MSRLHLKLLRDLRAAFWQFLAISIVAGLGVAMFQSSLVAYLTQKDSYELSYARLGFADVTVDMRRAPRAVVQSLSRLPGARAVEGRIVEEVEVEQEGGRRPRVIGRLITIPAGKEPEINRVRLLSGRPLGTVSRREVLLEAAFAEANHYRPGDRLYLKFQGRRVTFVVAGIVTSPEYIYPVFGKQYSFPMPEIFGAMFVLEDQVAPLLGLTGSITEVVLRTEPGQEKAVGETIARRLRAYGSEKPMLRADQPSNKLLQSDLEGNKPFLVVMPMLFLGSAALAVSLALARWVQAQRGLIGFLRASGFSSRAILTHYLEVGLAMGVSGGILGVGMGSLLGLLYAAAYEKVLRIPYRAQETHPEVIALAFGLSVAACLLGAFGPARQAASILPAEAMRGQMPRIPLQWTKLRLPLFLALPLRNLMRRPLRTLGTGAGVASAVILMLIAGAFRDSMGEALGSYLRDSKFDVSVTFVPERSEQILAYLRQWPGILRAEPSLELPIRAHHGDKEKEVIAIGVTPDSRLRRLPSASGLSLFPLPGTSLLTRDLMQRLSAERGDLLHLEYVQNTTERHADAEMRAGETVHQMVGTMAYIRLEELQRRFAAPLGMLPDAVNGAHLKVDPALLTSVRSRLNRTDGVAMVLTKDEIERQVNELTAFAQTFIAILYLLGAAMAFAVTFTTTDIVLWERTRELATLRTLGFSMGQLTLLVTIENLLMAALGAAAGVLPGIYVARFLMEASQTEGFSMQVLILPQTYLLSLMGALAVVFFAQWPGLRRIRRLDLAAAIRLRDE